MSPRHFLSGSRLFTRKKTFSVQYTICETLYRRESNNFITVRRSNNIRYILPSTLVMMRGWNETEENKEMGEEEKNITTSPSTTSRDVMKLVCGFFFAIPSIHLVRCCLRQPVSRFIRHCSMKCDKYIRTYTHTSITFPKATTRIREKKELGSSAQLTGRNLSR